MRHLTSRIKILMQISHVKWTKRRLHKLWSLQYDIYSSWFKFCNKKSYFGGEGRDDRNNIKNLHGIAQEFRILGRFVDVVRILHRKRALWIFEVGQKGSKKVRFSIYNQNLSVCQVMNESSITRKVVVNTMRM